MEEERGKTALETADNLCVEYWLKLSELKADAAKRINMMLVEYLKVIPMEGIHFRMKKRLELHEILKTVVDASDDDILDGNIERDTFQQLHQMCAEFNEQCDVSELACLLIADFAESRQLFGQYRKLKQFDLQDILTLNEEDFNEFQTLLSNVLRLTELKYYYPIPATVSRENMKGIFQNNQTMYSDIFASFIRIFCFELESFHSKCGVPFQAFCSEADYDPGGQVKSSPESVNESFQTAINSPSKRKRRRIPLYQELRSRSPPKDSEIVRGGGLLWDDNLSICDSTRSISSKKIKWTAEETNSLVLGYKRYGRQPNKWECIRFDVRYSLQHKTGVQLKDRWRNLCKKDPALRGL